MSRLERVRGVGTWQAEICEKAGAPTWAAAIRALLDGLDGDSAVRSLLLDDDGDPSTSMLWLRLLGAVHRLALDDPASDLAAYLPTAGGRRDPERAAREVLRFVGDHTEAVRAEMRRRVQTNEVGRAGALSAALNWLGGELVLLELGTSAGLNLWLDRYRVTNGDSAWGPPDAPLVLDGLFAEGHPPLGPFSVRRRRGCDREPLDASDPADRRVLRSFVWPDQVERLSRIDAALAAAGTTGIDAADGIGWTRKQLAELEPGRTVVYHSLVLPYLTTEEEAALAAVIEDAGRRADPARSLAWVTVEPFAGGDPRIELAVRRWPESDAHRLATLAPHGGEIRWDPRPLPGPRPPTPKAGAPV